MATSETENETETTTSSMDRVIVLDIGKKKRKQIKKLCKGGGKLLGEVEEHLEELRAAGAIDAAAQPVIVVVKEKQDDRLWR